MKNFLELLATDFVLDVVVDGQHRQAGLHQQLVFDADSTVTVDGIDILPKFQYLAQNGQLTISQPFYQWYHQQSNQGWLLRPV